MTICREPLYHLTLDLFGTDYLDEDNNLLQTKRPPETNETIQRISIEQPGKTLEERKMEARCIRMREAQVTRYVLKPTFVLPDTRYFEIIILL